MPATIRKTSKAPPAPPDLKAALISHARELGFDAVNVASPASISEAGNRLMTFIAEGRHGDMDWMETTAERRRDPRVLWPDVKSIVMLGMSYAPVRNPLDALEHPDHGAISVYAQGRDYHDVVKAKLKALARWLYAESGQDLKVFVDTAPLMEKPLAQAAGLGWQGKHTNLVSREHGSWLFLGAIASLAELAPDEAERDHCGSCRRCLDVCPTAAFPAPYQLDARRCIAYLTIEYKGHIDRAFRTAIGNRVFGCDDCLSVCPWNKFAEASREAKFAAVDGADLPPLKELLALDDEAFRARFRGTPVKRTGLDRFLRNALIAAGNSGDRDLVEPVKRHLASPSPLVRAMAAWALEQLLDPGDFAQMRAAALTGEQDPDVIAEWKSGSVSTTREDRHA